MFHRHFNFVTVRLWSNFMIAIAFESDATMKGRRLLEGGAYSDLGLIVVTLIKEWYLFEVRLLLKEIRYLCTPLQISIHCLLILVILTDKNVLYRT